MTTVRKYLINSITPCCNLPFKSILFLIENSLYRNDLVKNDVKNEIKTNGKLTKKGWDLFLSNVNFLSGSIRTEDDFKSSKKDCKFLKDLINSVEFGIEKIDTPIERETIINNYIVENCSSNKLGSFMSKDEFVNNSNKIRFDKVEGLDDLQLEKENFLTKPEYTNPEGLIKPSKIEGLDLDNLEVNIIQREHYDAEILTNNNLSRLSLADKIFNLYDVIDLSNNSIEIGENVTLNFVGGKFKNGTLLGKNTKIYSERKQIFQDVNILGTWDIDVSYSDWFNCSKNGYVYEQERRMDKMGNDYFVTKLNNNEFFVNGESYTFGSSVNVNYSDDTDKIQNLLNLSATTTVISEGIYMININQGQNMQNAYFGGLCLDNVREKTIILNGTLKAIQSNRPQGSILRFQYCDNINLKGKGAIIGDVCEHIGNGEGCMGLYTIDTPNVTVEGIKLNLNFGDGTYTAWSKKGGSDNQSYKHYYKDCSFNENRRTGYVIERHSFLTQENCDFISNGRIRGVGTGSGVDVEPFDWPSAPHAFAYGVTWRECRFINNRYIVNEINAYGCGLRIERSIGINVDNCYFDDNYTAVALLQCDSSRYTQNWIIGNDGTEAVRIRGANFIKNCSFYDNDNVLCGAEVGPSNVTFKDNFIGNAKLFLSGFFLNSLIKDNQLFNIGRYVVSNTIKEVLFEGNVIKHIAFDGGYASGKTAFRFGGLTDNYLTTDNRFKYGAENITFKNEKYIDYSGKVLEGFGERGIEPLPIANSIGSLIFGTNTKNIQFIDCDFSLNMVSPKMEHYGHEEGYTFFNSKPILISEKINFYKGQRVIDEYGQTAKVVKTGFSYNWDETWSLQYLIDKATEGMTEEEMSNFNTDDVVIPKGFRIKRDRDVTFSQSEATIGNPDWAYISLWTFDNRNAMELEWEGIGKGAELPDSRFNSNGRLFYNITDNNLYIYKEDWVLA